MDLERIEALARLMQGTGLTELELCEGEDKIRLSRQAAAVAAGPAARAADVPFGAAASAPAAVDANTLTAPLVGCVYLSPSPDAEAFVGAGSAVSKGQVLCIIEAMKVMNEFLAPRDGVIAEVCVDSGELVEYGQPLFRLR